MVFTRSLTRLLIALLVAVTGQVALIAPQSEAIADQDAAALLQSSAATMLELESFHFRLTTPVGETILTEDVFLKSVEGDVVRPMSFQATFEVAMAFLKLKLSAVGIDNSIWISNPMDGGEFMQVSGEGTEMLPPIPFLNPDALILAAMSQILEPAISGEEEIDGHQTTVVTGTFDPAAVALDGTPIAQGLTAEIEPLGLTIWIDAEHRVIRVEFAGGLLPSEIGAGRIVRRIDLSRFDEPVNIEPPAA